MWKPKEVVPEHRWRARILWASLLVAITAYTSWQGWKMYDDFKNPSTSLEVTDEVYEFPYVLVCFFQGEGCGWEDENMDECVSQSLEFSSVIDHNGNERTDGVVVESMWNNCVGYDLTQLNVVEAGITPSEAVVSIDMEWTVTDVASTEVGFYDKIAVYLSDEEPTESTLSFLAVPYTRYVPDDEALLELNLAELTIGKTTKKNLDGDITTTYPPLILSSSTLASNNTWTSQTTTDYAYGQLNIRLNQGPFSRVSVKEISPLDLGGFLGNIGGFWELLIILWGVFFIAARSDDTPTLRARKLPSIRRRSLSVDSGTTALGEERPHWEPTRQGANPSSVPPPLPACRGVTMAGGTAAAVGFPVMAPMNGGNNSSGHHRRQSNGSASSSTASSRRPVVQDAPRRGSRSGSGVSGHQDPVPPSYFAVTHRAA